MKRTLTAVVFSLAAAFSASAQSTVKVDVSTVGNNVQVFVDVRVVETPQPSSQQVQCPALHGYMGAIHGYRVQPQSFEAAHQALSALGLDVSRRTSTLWPERLEWFAAQPTVFYYSTQSAGMAENLANCLGQITGYPFTTQIGAGLGVPSGEEATTLFVHLVQ